MKRVNLEELNKCGLDEHWIRCDNCKHATPVDRLLKADICETLEKAFALEQLKQ